MTTVQTLYKNNDDNDDDDKHGTMIVILTIMIMRIVMMCRYLQQNSKAISWAPQHGGVLGNTPNRCSTGHQCYLKETE